MEGRSQAIEYVIMDSINGNRRIPTSIKSIFDSIDRITSRLVSKLAQQFYSHVFNNHTEY